MTVSSTESRISQSCDGITTDFPVPFYFLEASHLVVSLVEPDGTITPWTLGSEYTVSGAGNPSGGEVIAQVAPAAGNTLIIQRVVPLTQETAYQENDPFSAKSHERALDKLTMAQQQLTETGGRSLTRPVTDQAINSILPPNSELAGNALGFDAQGNPIAIPSDLPAVVNMLERAEAAAGESEAARDQSVASAAAAAGSANAASSSAQLAEASAEVAAAAGKVFPTSAAGVDPSTGVPAGQYYWVVSASTADVLELWRNVGGVATDTGKRTISSDGVRAFVAPLRLQNLYPDPGLTSATVPPTRDGGELVPITDTYLNGLGVVNGIRNPINTSCFVLVPIEDDWIGRYVVMSYFKHNPSGAPAGGTTARYLAGGTTLVSTGLTATTVTIDAHTIQVTVSGRIPAGLGITALAIGGALGAIPSATLVAGITYGLADAPVTRDSFEWDVFHSIRNARLEEVEAQIQRQGDELEVVESKTAAIPREYVRNYEPNGNLKVATAWTRTGSGVYESVASVAELAILGIVGAYRITPPSGGNTASRFDTNDSTIGPLAGAQPGDNIMIGSFLYASDGITYPTASNLSAYVIYQDGVIRGNDEWGYVQVNPKVRFYWAKFNGLVGALTRVIIGWNASANTFPDAPGVTRYHTGLFVTHSPNEIPTPTPANFPDYLAWDGERSASEFFDDLNDLLNQGGPASPAPKLVLGGTGLAESYIEVRQGAQTLRRAFTPYQNPSLTIAGVFNLSRDQVGDLVLRAMGDDVAPLHALGTTIGANHGYAMTPITAAAHGKTAADIGSVYTNGGVEYVLVGISSANVVYLTARASNATVPAGTFTYVSGGTSSTDIVGTAAGATAALTPAINKRSIRCYVDGVQVTETTANLRYTRSVAFSETYDILEKSPLVEWFISTGGAGDIDTLAGALRLTITYEFFFDGTLTIYADFLALKDGVPLTDIMVLQAVDMTANDGSPVYYVPKAVPFTFLGNSYDFANGVPSSAAAGWSGRLLFTPARCEANGILCDTFLQLTDNYGFAMGFLPEDDAGITERRAHCTVSALEIRNVTKKVYMRGVDKGDITLNTGDYFSFKAYRNIFKRVPGRTAAFPVRTNAGDYFHVYWHSSGVDAVPLPPDFAGRQFEVTEKSDNVTVLSQRLTNVLTVSVSNASSNGYLRLKVAP